MRFTLLTRLKTQGFFEHEICVFIFVFACFPLPRIRVAQLYFHLLLLHRDSDTMSTMSSGKKPTNLATTAHVFYRENIWLSALSILIYTSWVHAFFGDLYLTFWRRKWHHNCRYWRSEYEWKNLRLTILRHVSPSVESDKRYRVFEHHPHAFTFYWTVALFVAATSDIRILGR